jgi:hypothetical protein
MGVLTIVRRDAAWPGTPERMTAQLTEVYQMRTTASFCLMLLSSLSATLAISQNRPSPRIQLTDAPIERKLNYAVWRTDYYICTGIAHAKSLGRTPEDFAAFVASKHSLGSSREKGLAPIVRLLHFVIENYNNGRFDVISESDSAVTMKNNRPYASLFKNGPVFGVTLEEFETYLWSHIAIMANRIGFDFVYHVEGEYLISTLSIKE